MGKKDLLFEIGSEEIPAGFIGPALDALSERMAVGLRTARLGFGSVRTLGTPRRLALIVEGVDGHQPDATIEVRGPRKEAAFDAAGKPTKALEGFAKGQGVGLDDIKIISSDKGEVAAAIKHVKGEPAARILPDLLAKLITPDLFKKTMRWGNGDAAFARPVHWIVALYGGEVISFSFGNVKSGSATRGHRFLAGNAEIALTGAGEYAEALKRVHVIVDPADRKKIIRDGIEKAAKDAGGEVLQDEGLVDEVANLVEFPKVLCGRFDVEFLKLPPEVVINAMREHQRYFSVKGANGLLPCFITIANMKAIDPAVVIKGNERVLRARLNDAKFHFENDIKAPLKDNLKRLKGVVFQAKLGTSYEKVERFTALSLRIAEMMGLCDATIPAGGVEEFLADAESPANFPIGSKERFKRALARAALLAKADLVSGMVGEFPKLQGVMGGVYAARGGEAGDVSTAIREHYMPVSAGAELPTGLLGAVVGMADRMDTIAGCYGVGLVPTGAQDPYGLRRAALAVIAIVMERGLKLSVNALIDEAVNGLGDKLKRDSIEISSEIREFFKERLKNLLLSKGFSYDSIDAVLSTDWSGVADATTRVAAIEEFKKDPDAGRLTVAFKRVSNILKDSAFEPTAVPGEKLLSAPEEKALFKARTELAPRMERSLGQKDYHAALKMLTSIKETIDAFFDEVMVMVEDVNVRENRLLLLHSVRALYYRIADLSRLVI
jgi:glycyl-tRNA synthetase beta chain